MQIIHLYLGAHKTATTHLTGILIANREHLESSGISLSTPGEVRKGWLPNLFSLTRERRDGDCLTAEDVNVVQSLQPSTERWILSEENMVGVASELRKPGGIYRFGHERIAMVKEMFPDAYIRLFFSVRSFDTYYRSMYSEEVRNGGFLPWNTFYKPDIYAKRSWTETLSRFAQVLPQEDIVLWRFEDFRAVLPKVLREMTGLKDVSGLIDAYSRKTTRPSLSQKTMDILADLAPAIGPKETLALTERINRHYSVSEGYAPFQPFSEDEIASLRNRYDADLENMREALPELNYIAP